MLCYSYTYDMIYTIILKRKHIKYRLRVSLSTLQGKILGVHLCNSTY